MNFSIIVYILSWVMLFEGFFFGLPAITSAIYRESSVFSFLIMMIVCIVVGLLGIRKKPENVSFYAKEGFVIVGLSWIILSILGALPFYISGEIPSYVDALFETISGFTTTGASILENVEALSHGMLLWRSFTHWIGGMGFLVFILMILPLTGGSNMHIMKAESPGPSVGKLVPKVRDTAVILYEIYILMTVLQMMLLTLTGMPLFDSITLSFGTAGTGGFGILNSSTADYTILQQGIISVFMMLFGINFSAYFFVFNKKFKDAFLIDEVRWYLIIIACSTLFIGFNISGSFDSIFEAMHHSFFQVNSVITTTGFSTVDFNVWPTSCKALLVMLMFVGACSGSTGGGMKVSRFVLMFRSLKAEINTFLHPRSVKKIRMDGRNVDNDVIRSVNAFLIAYIGIFVISLFIISLEGKDLVTSFTSVAATLNNIGPGLEEVGPAANFHNFSDVSKIVFMFDMLAGRLELFPMLVLFAPSTWKNR